MEVKFLREKKVLDERTRTDEWHPILSIHPSHLPLLAGEC